MKILLWLCITSASLHAAGQSGDKEMLQKLNQGFLNSIISQDSAAQSAILADDFLLINPGGVKRTKKDCLSGVRQPGVHVISITIDQLDIRLLTAEVGIVSAWTTNTIETGGKRTTLKISYSDVYQKRGGEWKAVAAHVSALP
jgi:hypothetical protein